MTNRTWRLAAILALFALIMALPVENYNRPNLKVVGRFEAKTAEQLEIFTDTHSDLLAHGPYATGKTHVGAVKGYFLAKKYPGLWVALIRKKRVHLEATLWAKFLSILPVEDVARKNDSKLWRKLHNGSEIHGLGLDSEHSVNLMDSREFGFAVIEEAKEINEQIYLTKIKRCMRQQYLLDGTILPFRQVLSLTNPDAPGHFLYQNFIRKPLPGYHHVKGTRLPDLAQDYVDFIMSLPGIWGLRYRDGLWTAFEGLVYPFDEEQHVVNKADLWEGWESWRRVVAVDFGVDHPCVVQWWAVSPSDLWVMYKEIYMTGRSPGKIAKQVREEFDKEGINPVVICDHDSGAVATWEEQDLDMEKADKDRLGGQGSVYELFEQDRILFVRDALIETDYSRIHNKLPTCTIEEFGSYTWLNKLKQDMCKEKDDGMDTMRYAIHTSRHEPDPRARWL